MTEYNFYKLHWRDTLLYIGRSSKKDYYAQTSNVRKYLNNHYITFNDLRIEKQTIKFLTKEHAIKYYKRLIHQQMPECNFYNNDKLNKKRLKEEHRQGLIIDICESKYCYKVFLDGYLDTKYILKSYCINELGYVKAIVKAFEERLILHRKANGKYLNTVEPFF